MSTLIISGITVNILYILLISVALNVKSENLVGIDQIKWANINMRALNGRESTLSNWLDNESEKFREK